MAAPAPSAGALQGVLRAARKGFFLGAAARLPFAIIEVTKSRPTPQSVITLARLCARSALIIGGFSGLYKLLRLVFGHGKSSDSAVAIFLSAGLSAQTMTFLSPSATKELALYVVKFVLEGLINASPKGSVTENPAMQRLSLFVLFGVLVALFEKQPATLKPVVVRLLNVLWA